MQTIEGNKYIGKFNVNIKSGEFWSGSEYYECKDTLYWYNGPSIIEDKKTQKKCFFKLESLRFETKNGPFEDYIIQWGGNYLSKANLKPINEKSESKIVDLVLGEMFAEAKKLNEDIPTISPKKLDYINLIERGLIPDVNGQILLPLTT